jgi:predicted phage terminase large subunit-like protein
MPRMCGTSKRERVYRSVINAWLDQRCESNLKLLIRRAWHVVQPGTKFTDGPHIDALCEHLTAVTRGQIRNLLINVPPRHMKSLAVGVFWPAWEWISAPQRRWLFASYASTLSERDSNHCRRLIQSQWYQSRWGSRFRLCDDQNAKHRFENDKSGSRIATSVGGWATGEGGDRVVVDDPHNVVDRESEAARLEALRWWDESMSTRLNDPKTGAKVIVMQRIHEKDLSGHVLEQGGYVHLCLPAEFETSRRCVTVIGWRDWRKAEGELLWPDRVGPKEIAEFRRTLGSSAYAGQFQQRPSPAGGARFRAEWFRYFTIVGASEDAGTMKGRDCKLQSANCKVQIDGDSPTPAVPQFEICNLHFAICNPQPTYAISHPDGSQSLIEAKTCHRFAVMDPAGTEPGHGTRPCYTVIQVWDLTPAGDMLLIHQYRKQVTAPDAAIAAVQVCRDFGVAYIAIEKDGLGLGVVQQVRKKRITVKAIKARGSKQARSETAEIKMEAGQIHFPRGAPFLFELEKELLQFPRSDYADQVDALAHAAIQVQRIGERGKDESPDTDDAEDNIDENGVWQPM